MTLQLQERYQVYQNALLYITKLMNVPEFARVFNAAMWTHHPTSNLIKEVFADTQLLCDSCLWPCNSRIQKNLEGGIYPAHLMISATPKEWKWHHRRGNMRLFKTRMACGALFDAVDPKKRRRFGNIRMNDIVLPENQCYWKRVFKEDYGTNQFILEII